MMIGNDAMNNIVLPSKLELAAKVALENARAALIIKREKIGAGSN